MSNIKTFGQQSLWQYIEKHKLSVENTLREHLPYAPPQIQTNFNEALEYSLFPGGKRLRPYLTMLGAEIVGGNPESVLAAAIGVEYIHTSSLIFDDLPGMDNSPHRRGKESLHEKYGEGMAVLVGLALLNCSYGLVFVNQTANSVEALKELVECIGSKGMVGGQALDLALAKGETQAYSTAQTYEIESIRNLKTSALMRLALRIGAILSSANEIHLTALSRFAELMGDAYQLSDDLIDLQEDGEIFSKDQSTFAIEKGIETAKIQLKNLINNAKNVLLESFPANEARANLQQFADYLGERKA